MSVALAAAVVAGCGLLPSRDVAEIAPTLSQSVDAQGATYTLDPWPLDNNVAFLCLREPGAEFTVAHPLPAPDAQCVPLHVEAMGRLADRPFLDRQRAARARGRLRPIRCPVVLRRRRVPRCDVDLNDDEPRGLADPQRRGSVLMRIVVTGGAGFIGSRVVARLRDRGEQVVALVRDPAKAPRLDGLGAELVADDLSDPARLREHLEAADAVIHAAGSYRIGITADERPAMWDANVGTTDAAPRGGGGGQGAADRLRVHGRTCSATRMAGSWTSRIGATSRWASSATYDETKYRAHEVAERRIEAGAPIVIAMPGTVVGPGDHTVLGEQLVQAYRGRLPYVAAADMGVAPAHVDDVAAGHHRGPRARRGRPRVRARGRLHPVRRGAPDRGRGRRARRCRGSGVPDGLLRVDGAVRAARRAAERAARWCRPRRA